MDQKQIAVLSVFEKGDWTLRHSRKRWWRGFKTYCDIISRVFAKQFADLFRNLIIDFCLCVLPSRMYFAVAWTSHRLPASWGRIPDIFPPIPSDAPAERDNYFFQIMVDSNESTEIIKDIPMRVTMLLDIVQVLERRRQVWALTQSTLHSLTDRYRHCKTPHYLR